jgi:hypothetical protein
MVKGIHNCKQNGSIKTAEIGEIYDASAEIKEMIQESSIEDVSKSVQSIAKRVFGEIQQKHKGRSLYLPYFYYYIMRIDMTNKRIIVIILGIAIKSYNDSQMRSLVYQARAQNVGDWVTAIQ